MQKEQEKKPKVLYHASANPDIKEFTPRAEKVRDPEEGPVVFATPDKCYASMFIVRTDDRWSCKGKFGDVFYQVINNRDRFTNMDHGGSVYELPPDTFSTDENRGMRSLEWISREPVLVQ